MTEECMSVMDPCCVCDPDADKASFSGYGVR